MNRRNLLIIILLTIALPWTVFGQNDNSSRDATPKYSNEFLNLGVDARSFAMATTAVSQTNDVSAGYWNPAGLLQLESDQHQLALMHAAYFGGLANYDYAAFATSLDSDSRLGLSIIRFAVDDIPDTRFLFDANGTLNYDNIRFFSAADYALVGSYARKLPFLNNMNAGGQPEKSSIERSVTSDMPGASDSTSDFKPRLMNGNSDLWAGIS